MELEKIAAVVRPRRPWEAIDLGFRLVRTFWRPLLFAWLALVLPLWIAVATTAWTALGPGWAVFALWWLKPLYDRVPLFVLSRALFGAPPSVRDARRELRRQGLGRAAWDLTLGRFDPRRSFHLPVRQLEGLAGAARRARLQDLQRGGDADAASWLTVAALVFETSTLFALLGLLHMLRPETVGVEVWGILDFDRGLLAFTLYTALYFLSVTLIEPFYVAGGFTLYLNRRTHLEGWDVELALRRLARRLRSGGRPEAPSRAAPRAGVALLLGLASALAGVAAPTPASSQPPATAPTTALDVDPQQAIAEVLASDDFPHPETVETWRPRQWDGEGLSWLSGLSDWLERIVRWLFEGDPEAPEALPWLAVFGQILEILLWGVLGLALAALLIYVLRRLPDRLPGRRREPGEALPIRIGRHDIRPESLPDDVAAAALALWRDGRAADALALLYRGALAALVVRRRLPARPSWTEGDCLRHLERHAPESLVAYFRRLTHAWLRVAYGHRPPATGEIEGLTADWPAHFTTAHFTTPDDPLPGAAE